MMNDEQNIEQMRAKLLATLQRTQTLRLQNDLDEATLDVLKRADAMATPDKIRELRVSLTRYSDALIARFADLETPEALSTELPGLLGEWVNVTQGRLASMLERTELGILQE